MPLRALLPLFDSLKTRSGQSVGGGSSTRAMPCHQFSGVPPIDASAVLIFRNGLVPIKKLDVAG